jgi:hypothetical protein
VSERKNLDEILWRPYLVIDNELVHQGKTVDREPIIIDLQCDTMGVPVIPNKDDLVIVNGRPYLVVSREWDYDAGSIKVEAR